MISFSNFKSQLVSASTSAAGIELGGGGTVVYATIDQLPRSGNETGDTAFVSATSRFYIWNGVGWFNVAMVNNTPTITNAPSSTYNLYANGAPTIITLAATDADGDNLTWSYNAPGATGKATITQVSNVFTVTPLTNIADTSFIIDFEVTDDVNVSTASSTINIDNRAPIIDAGVAASYVLATDGSPTVITLAATDPDGGSITWSYAESGLTNQATIAQNGNEFTITPTTNVALYADFVLTFTASDSIESTSTDATVFSLQFRMVADEWADTSISVGTSSTDGLDNSTFIDRSTNAHTIEVTGSPTQTAFHPYLDNWSAKFDGVGDFIQTQINPIGTSDYTIEAWVWADPNIGSDNGWLALSDGPDQKGYTTGTFIAPGYTGYIYSYQATLINQGSGSFTLAKWHHIALCRSGNVSRMFLDGIQQGSDLTDTRDISATYLLLGGYYGTTSNLWKGYISNFRLVNGTGLYTTNFTPPTEKLTAVPNTEILVFQSNRFIDESTNNYSLNGDSKVSAFNPFGQESEYAPGQNKGSVYLHNQGISIAAADTANLEIAASEDFTIEMWVNLTNVTNRQCITSWWGSSSDNRFRFEINKTAGNIFALIGNSEISGTHNMFNYAWHHLAFVRNSNTVNIYVDGTSVTSGILSGAISRVNSNSFIIGSRDAVGDYVKGYISDFKVTPGTAVYTSTFTPPTAPVDTTNASLYLPMDNAGIFDKTGNHTLTPVGNASTSTTQTKFADTAVYFDGSGDFLSLAGNASLQMGSNNFTIEAWIYINAHKNFNYIYSYSYPYQILVDSNGNLESYFNGTDNSITYLNVQGSLVIPTATWTHVAIVRNGSSFTQYINGVSDGSATDTFTLPIPSTYDPTIGDWGGNGYGMNGYIENFQILKGVAKYTANFTPPTQEQDRVYQAKS